MRRVGICGLGYVGCVTAGCLARRGHEVVGLDVVAAKVDMVGRGVAPFFEPGLRELLEAAAGQGRLRATTDTVDAVRATDTMILCVGTPTADDDTPDLRFLADAAARIGAALRGGTTPYTVIVRSTVPPGTIEEVVIPTLEREARRLVGADGLTVLAVPEFLREGSAIADFDDPAFIIVGAPTPAPDGAREVVSDLFPFADRQRWTDYKLAELLKCVCNAYHAVKTVFANEVGALCTALGIDGRRLMEILCEDRKLNTSAAYLRPGGPFGGSCLPKDLRALLHLARREELPAMLLRSTLESNAKHVAQTTSVVERLGRRRVGLHGLAFKDGTDDLRESPMVAIAESLIARGYDVRIFDPLVLQTRDHAPHAKGRLLELLVGTPEELLRHAEVVVVRGGSAALQETAQAMGATPVLVELGRRPRRTDPVRVLPVEAPPIGVAPALTTVSTIPAVEESLVGAE
jgi:GDP-mannose 6-dehydrogenase